MQFETLFPTEFRVQRDYFYDKWCSHKSFYYYNLKCNTDYPCNKKTMELKFINVKETFFVHFVFENKVKAN